MLKLRKKTPIIAVDFVDDCQDFVIISATLQFTETSVRLYRKKYIFGDFSFVFLLQGVFLTRSATNKRECSIPCGKRLTFSSRSAA